MILPNEENMGGTKQATPRLLLVSSWNWETTYPDMQVLKENEQGLPDELKLPNR